MSATPNNGGSAFPVTLDHRGCVGAYGMSMRDWFAGMALQGWLASYEPSAAHPVSNEAADGLALLSYDMADAMLAARTKGGSDE